MSIFIRRFRDWWQPPRKAGNRLEHRQVSFLELFYDLVYVVLISQLSHALAEHIDWTGVVGYAFLFIIVWWAWFNGSSYHDLHGNNDIRTRVFTFLQMLCVVAMAVFVGDALGETSVGFALSYAAFQLILTYLWWRTGVHDPYHRPLSRPYVGAFLINALLFAGSIFVSAPWRFYLWGLALIISLLLPLYIILVLGKRNPDAQAQIEIVTTVSPSLVERFGLFTIIVLGEVIVGVVNGVIELHQLNWLVGLIAVLCALIAIGLWWIYFDFVSHHLPRSDTVNVSAWFYLHLPLAMGIAAVGAAVFNVVKLAGGPLPFEVRWLLVAAVGIALISITILTRTIQIKSSHQLTYQVASRVMLISALLTMLLGLLNLPTIPLLFVIIVLLLAPIIFAFRVSIDMLDQID